MSQIVRIGLLTAAMWIALVTSLPLAKNDLIQGPDFVSLFINSQRDASRRQRPHASATIDSTDMETAVSSYSPRFSRPATISIQLNAAPSDDDEEGENSMNSYTVNGTKVVELVTTGSKIVFLEDVDDVNQTDFRSTKANLNGIYDTSIGDAPADEIKVVSISVSSSSARRNQAASEDTNEYPMDEHSGAQDGRQLSSLGSSQLSIEEDDDPYVEEKLPSDSMRGESLKFERILTAPAMGPMVNNEDEDLSPIEGLVIHDQDYHIGGGARPRSVSYSSITQSVNDKVWRGSISYNHTQPPKPVVTQATQEPQSASYSVPEQIYSEPAKVYSEAAKVYSEPAKIYSEPAKVYSEPAKVYSEPEKIYSEPAKIYSEPARVYSEPAKVYSKPAKVYSEPSRNYGEPSKVYSNSPNIPNRPTTSTTTTTTPPSTTTTTTSTSAPRTASVYYSEHQVSPVKRVVFNLDKLPYDLLNAPVTDDNKNYLFAPHLETQRFHHFNRKSQDQQFQSKHQLPPSARLNENPPETKSPPAEGNYEVDEAVSVMSNGRDYQPPATPPDGPPKEQEESADSGDAADPKVGFVVEGRNFRKYRVEEKTPDGFIVGEYGVVSTNDGSLRGVRYTADSNISPNLIYEALMKFLAL